MVEEGGMIGAWKGRVLRDGDNDSLGWSLLGPLVAMSVGFQGASEGSYEKGVIP